MYLKHTVLNGSSEGINSIATAVTVWIFNMALIYYAGEDGVSAFAVINYLGSFVILIMFGVADGITTLVSYNYGAGLFQRVRRILNSALLLNFAVGVLIFLVMNFYSEGLVGMFVTNNPKIVEMAVQGAQLYSLAFLFNGINIVYSGYQTALGNALNSAVIAGSRGLIFIVIGALLLPLLFDLNGVWLTISFAEACTLLICLCIEKKQKYSIA